MGHLVLQQTGVGGDDHGLPLAARPEDDGKQVGEGLARAGGGFHDHEAVVLQRPTYELDHLELGLPPPETMPLDHSLELRAYRFGCEGEIETGQTPFRHGRGMDELCDDGVPVRQGLGCVYPQTVCCPGHQLGELPRQGRSLGHPLPDEVHQTRNHRRQHENVHHGVVEARPGEDTHPVLARPLLDQVASLQTLADVQRPGQFLQTEGPHGRPGQTGQLHRVHDGIGDLPCDALRTVSQEAQVEANVVGHQGQLADPAAESLQHLLQGGSACQFLFPLRVLGEAELDLEAEGDLLPFQVHIFVEHRGKFRPTVGDSSCRLAIHKAHGGDLDDAIAFGLDAGGLQVKGDESFQRWQIGQEGAMDLSSIPRDFLNAGGDLFCLYRRFGAPHATGQGDEKIRVAAQGFPDLERCAAQAIRFDDGAANLPLGETVRVIVEDVLNGLGEGLGHITAFSNPTSHSRLTTSGGVASPGRQSTS